MCESPTERNAAHTNYVFPFFWTTVAVNTPVSERVSLGDLDLLLRVLVVAAAGLW